MEKMSTNKVYIVSNGYDEINCFTDKGKAEACARRLNFVPMDFFNRYRVTEYKLNPDLPSIPTSVYACAKLDLGSAVKIQDIYLKREFVSFNKYPFNTKYDNPWRVIYGLPFLEYQIRLEHEIPIYPDDTWKSILKRGYESLNDDLEKWKEWKLKKGHKENRH